MSNYDSGNFERAVIELCKKKPFLGALLQNMSRKFDTTVPTAGVCVTDKVNIVINPYFFDSLSLDEQVDLLAHETYHVLHNHFARFRELDPASFEKVEKNTGDTPGDVVVNKITGSQGLTKLNQAGDFAINEFLPNLPKTFKLFDKEGKPITNKEGKVVEVKPCIVSDQKGWEKNKNLEYYYAKIKEEVQKNKSKGGGKSQGEGDGDQDGQSGGSGEPGGKGPQRGTIDDHSLWNQNHPDDEYVLEKIKQAVNKAAEACNNSGMGAGDIPADIQTLIDKLNYKARDWRGDLNRFVARSSEIIREDSRKRRNRRYGLMYAGNVNYPKLKLGVAIDTSGSMSGEPLNQVAAELERIASNNVEVIVIEADCQINKVWNFDKKKFQGLNGGGGTAYQPALDEAEKHDIDALIYLGDMDAADRPKKPTFPVLWGVTEQGGRFQDPPAKFGKKVEIRIQKKH